MANNGNRGWISLQLSIGLSLLACSNSNNPGFGSGGAGGEPSMSPITGTAGMTPAGTSGATGSSGAPAQTGTGGTSQSPDATAGKPAGTSGMTATAGMPAGGSNATAGAGGDAAGAGGAPGKTDYGKGDGKDVITIGDSWMSLGIGQVIEGALDRAGTNYRHYAVAGTLLLNGQIPGQYDQAKAQNPKILTVLMTGGGNDIMFSNGCATKESCAMAVQQISDGLNELWTKMEADGVKDVVYVAYSKNAGTAPSDTRPAMSPTPMICTKGTIRCWSVDTTMEVAATDTLDGIHPNNAASDRIAKKVLALMEMNGMRR